MEHALASGHLPAQVKPRSFAFDFDGTLTADGHLLGEWVRLGLARGHRFYCVTARSETEDAVATVNDWLDAHRCQMPIVFCSLGSKLAEVARRGIEIDIWLDDDPTTLVHGH